MDKQTREALEESIRHWEGIRDEKERGTTSRECALCRLVVYLVGSSTRPGILRVSAAIVP
jgi:hypothetical protein